MSKLVGLSGSLRKGSFNTAVLKFAESAFPDDFELGSIEGIPLYNADEEAAHGIPQPVEALKSLISSSRGLVLASPEYNNSIPGVFKNALDWLSRPPADIPAVFHHRPVAILGATPGGFGTVLAQNAWLPVLRTLKMRPWFDGRLMISGAHKLVDDQGNLIDPDIQNRITSFIEGFLAFSRDQAGPGVANAPSR